MGVSVGVSVDVPHGVVILSAAKDLAWKNAEWRIPVIHLIEKQVVEKNTRPALGQILRCAQDDKAVEEFNFRFIQFPVIRDRKYPLKSFQTTLKY